jgi:Family of unknown function (DUF5681)
MQMVETMELNSEATEGSRDRRKSLPQAYKPGQSGNPAGRPKGSRNKLGEAFIEDVYNTWKDRGKEVLDWMCENDPTAFARIVAGILPQKMEADVNHRVQVVLIPEPKSPEQLEALYSNPKVIELKPEKEMENGNQDRF